MKIEKCPFCGGEAILESSKLRYGTIYSAYCQKCGAEIAGFSEREAIAAWNRRCGKDINVATNADRIRSMSNMELAEMLVRYDSNLYGYYCPDGSFCDDEDSALSFALDWLDKPVKEELT